MSEISLLIVLPSYAMGSSIRPTLASITGAVAAWSSHSYTLVLSDSSPDDSPVAAVTQWAAEVGCGLVVDHSDTRRIQKDALNVAFSKPEVAAADIVVVTNDDVLLDVSSINHLVHALTTHPEATIAVGSARPDPQHSAGARRAAAWQLEVVAEIGRRLPPKSLRSEGALWATRGEFAETFRYPLGHGSIADDVALAEHISLHHLTALNVHQAIVYKVPPAGFAEFYQQTRRFKVAVKTTHASGPSLSTRGCAVATAALRNPAGALNYGLYRLGMLGGAGRSAPPPDEQWTRQGSTLR
jgi:hypothetical protein